MSRRGDNIRKRADGRWEGRYQIMLDRYVDPSMDTKRKYINALSADYGQSCGQICKEA